MSKNLFFLLLSLVGFVFCVSGQDHHAIVRKKLGKVSATALNEISGIVPSNRYDSCYWVHNDSGDGAFVYLIDSRADLLCTFELEGVEAVDFEDIAWLDRQGSYYLIAGDIGDNRGVRDNIRFYMFEEPEWGGGRHEIVPKAEISMFTAKYPDQARDAEAFFVDPFSNELILISKRDFHVHIYVSDMLNSSSTSIHQLNAVGQIPVFFVTAADISSDGRSILVKNLHEVFRWARHDGESVSAALARPYVKIPYEAEPQGEAIAFDRDGKSFYTISERPLGLDSYLYNYQFNTP